MRNYLNLIIVKIYKIEYVWLRSVQSRLSYKLKLDLYIPAESKSFNANKMHVIKIMQRNMNLT